MTHADHADHASATTNLVDVGSADGRSGDLLQRTSDQSTMSSQHNNNGAMDESLLKREEVVNQGSKAGIGRSSSANVNNGVGASNVASQAGFR